MQNLDLDPDEQDKMRSPKLIGWFDALKPIMSKYERSKDGLSRAGGWVRWFDAL